MYYPLPSELNPTAKKYYEKNIFCVTRQLFYSANNTDSIDVMLSLNGLPIMTMELKNHYTDQTIENAIKQYQNDRNPKEDTSALLLMKKRCAVHFAVDDDLIMMCTELCGNHRGFCLSTKVSMAAQEIQPIPLAYAPPICGKTYWAKFFVGHFGKLCTGRKEEKASQGQENREEKDVEKELVIWPRYHQLDAVRQMLDATRKGGVGQKFLIQHSAGSGKSNSITWLAYQLVGLLDGTTPLLDSVVVVTDRINLDSQIRDNINAFKRLKNIVEWADSSATLKDALKDGKKIIITIVHKFQYILEAIGTDLKDKRFGIIIDEAHSSQNGSLSAKMNMGLSGNVATDGKDLEDKLNAIIEGRKMVKNANYYAFTATPKAKTLEMFGTPHTKSDGEIEHTPFHEYTMKQAIEEGFIMDVLKTTPHTPVSIK